MDPAFGGSEGQPDRKLVSDSCLEGRIILAGIRNEARDSCLEESRDGNLEEAQCDLVLH
jgi:hypothetical protein